jgi:hypothetical protein
LTSESENLKPC